MEQRISPVTLGVADLCRTRAFDEALGWRGQELHETVFLQAGGLALVRVLPLVTVHTLLGALVPTAANGA
ncbi:hypothetical protein [Micromonospora sp. 4G55]|uniref:hypothetical protein n=1 Tax=Micromonospora sp. 4G55 TaxID=2806102 RepID=UPI001EE444ED|nr:hypothetical protein [Micromonospora sp. 4G55]